MRNAGLFRRLEFLLAGCGMVLFVIFGLFPDSYLGRAIGLDVTRIFLGLPVTSGIFSRWIVAAAMAMVVMVSGIMFIAVAATAGWILSTALYALTGRIRISRQQRKKAGMSP